MARVARWRFENGALTTDSQGTNTLTNTNGVTADTVNFNEGAASAAFASTSNQHFAITDTALNSGFPFKSSEANGLMTVCFFFKAASINTDRGLVTKYNHNNLRSWAISLASSTLRFSYGHTNGTVGVLHDDITTLATNKVYHVGFTLDSAGKTRHWRVWNVTDNILKASTTGLTQTNNVSFMDVPLNIGAFGYLANSAYAMNGNMDDVQIFDAILTDAEIDNVRLYGSPQGIVSPETGALAITGSTPAVGTAPASGSVSIAGGTPTPAVGIPALPSSGELTITGGTPSVSSLPIIMPGTGQLRITGQGPVLLTFDKVLGAVTDFLPTVQCEINGAHSIEVTDFLPTVDALGGAVAEIDDFLPTVSASAISGRTLSGAVTDFLPTVSAETGSEASVSDFLPTITSEVLGGNLLVASLADFLPTVASESLSTRNLTGAVRDFLPVVASQAFQGNVLTGTLLDFLPRVAGAGQQGTKHEGVLTDFLPVVAAASGAGNFIDAAVTDFLPHVFAPMQTEADDYILYYRRPA